MKIEYPVLSAEQYLEMEERAYFKSEYRNGEIVAMAGASDNHNLIVSNLVITLGACLEDTPCRVYPSDRLVHIPGCQLFTYPDVMIVCEEPQLFQYRGKLTAILNPSVVIEVLSESTKDYDRTTKADCYRSIPSLKQYVTVSQEAVSVESFSRIDTGQWMLSEFRQRNQTITIGDCELLIDRIYRKLVNFQG